jgi:succinoglycan biosynthesis protein ExoM
LIATTDDDLYADPRWLVSAFRALKLYEADTVHGPVLAQFQENTPDYIRDSFHRRRPSTGSTSGYFFTTANSLFRRSVIDAMEAPFDPKAGRIGGEDTSFFNGLRGRGCRMIWCNEAQVYSPLIPERLTMRSVLRRRMQFGYAAEKLGLDQTGLPHLLSLMGWIFVTFGVGVVYAVGGIVSANLRRKAVARAVMVLQLLASMCGRIAHHLGMRLEQYVER